MNLTSSQLILYSNYQFIFTVRRLGSICDTDDWCQREDSNLICDDNNVCSCMDGFAVSPDSKSTVCTAGEDFMYFVFSCVESYSISENYDVPMDIWIARPMSFNKLFISGNVFSEKKEVK